MHRILPLLLLFLAGCAAESSDGPLHLRDGDRVALIGGNLCSRMAYFGHFETALYQALPDTRFTVRNLCDPGNTAGFRPHAARMSPWAFPGAADYNPAVDRDSDSQGFFPSDGEWLDSLDADVVLAFFGWSESFAGPGGLTNFALELDSLIVHTQGQRYHGDAAPRLILLSPLAYEATGAPGLPDGSAANANLELYTRAMGDIAADHGVPFIDLFHPSRAWMAAGERLTTDGISLTDAGYRRLAGYLTGQLTGRAPVAAADPGLLARVNDKNRYWLLEFKMPNGVHAYGRRYDPYGPANYPYEKEKVGQLVRNRDTALLAYRAGESYDLAAADAATRRLPAVETNYAAAPVDSVRYRYGAEALASFTMAPGFAIDLFASEREFPELANPCQLKWDDRGRLWLAVMPSYPHYRPGDALPDDKLIILEDTDRDGRADTLKVWADSLHLPVGFEFADGGVFVSQGTNLVFLQDTDGDDRADRREIVLSGFDDHDTHHNISAYEADPGGGIYMGEGLFLHTNVETPYGPVRATNGGFYRYDPATRYLERTAQIDIPNPWGIVFDAWGQPVFAHTSSTHVRWMLPSTLRPVYGVSNPMAPDLIEANHRVRPTSGLEIVSSRHFPDAMQGDLLINNTIGFLGTKQHRLFDAGAGFDSRWRQDLVTSSDPNFRPVDMEFAPDGSLYLVDWHNVLVGHMQHNARDPLRDHVHGRVYRVTYPGRPLVVEPEVAGADVATLLDNLKLPEYRTRYRSRRALRERNPVAVLAAVRAWADALDREDPAYAAHLREALYVMWGAGTLDTALLDRAAASDEFRLRAVAARVVRYRGAALPDRTDRLRRAAADPHPRVRMEAVTAASWLPVADGEAVLAVAAEQERDALAQTVLDVARAHLHGRPYVAEDDAVAGGPGAELFGREAYCGTCHQADGRGLPATGYPPLAGSPWVTGSKERLIKLVLHGLHGPLELDGRRYDGQVPMTAYGGLMNDEEVAAVLTYVRGSFGNAAGPVTAAEVAGVREATAGRRGPYATDELLREHPFPPATKK